MHQNERVLSPDLRSGTCSGRRRGRTSSPERGGSRWPAWREREKINTQGMGLKEEDEGRRSRENGGEKGGKGGERRTTIEMSDACPPAPPEGSVDAKEREWSFPKSPYGEGH
jgi:hypothetical protein